MTQAPKIWSTFLGGVFGGQSCIFHLPPTKKASYPPLPSTEICDLAWSESFPSFISELREPTKTTILPSYWCHWDEHFGARDEVFSAPLWVENGTRCWTQTPWSFCTQLFPREVALTGSEEDEEGVMKLQRGITKSSKKGGITGRVVFFGRTKAGWVFDPSLENLQRALPLIFLGWVGWEMKCISFFGIRPIFSSFFAVSFREWFVMFFSCITSISAMS